MTTESISPPQPPGGNAGVAVSAPDPLPPLRPMVGDQLARWVEIEVEAAMLRAAVEAGAADAQNALRSLLQADEVLAVAALKHAGTTSLLEAAARVLEMTAPERASIVRRQGALNGVHLLDRVIDLPALYLRCYHGEAA